VTTSRAFGTFALVFAAAYAVVYVLAEQFNLAAFTYHPAIGEIDLGRVRSRSGPPMYWYGWMATSLIGAGVIGGLAALLPEAATRRLVPTAAWAVPILAMLAFCAFMAPFFLR
jgi:hypothetical protein